MKRLAVIAIVLAVCLVGFGCSSSSAKSKAGSAAQSASQMNTANLPQKNGFDEASNQAIDSFGVRFSVPGYFVGNGGNENVDLYTAMKEDGSKDESMAGAVRTQQMKASDEATFQKKKQETVMKVFETQKAFHGSAITDVQEGTIAGLPSAVYTITGSMDINSSTRAFIAKAGIFLNARNEVGILYFMQVDGAAYDYISDFDKIFASATVIEEAPAEAAGVSPDLKDVLDSYEAFVDEYIAFMQKYKDSGNASSMLMDYMDYMQKYSNLASKISAMDTNNMTAADYAYYIEVTSRVSQKLLSASL